MWEFLTPKLSVLTLGKRRHERSRGRIVEGDTVEGTGSLAQLCSASSLVLCWARPELHSLDPTSSQARSGSWAMDG